MFSRKREIDVSSVFMHGALNLSLYGLNVDVSAVVCLTIE